MQTAVEWLINEHFGGIDNCTPHFRNSIKQALEMEKQQIIDFADEYGTYLLQGGTMSATSYNKTFKSE